MYHIPFGKSGMQVPTVAVGCMRIAEILLIAVNRTDCCLCFGIIAAACSKE